MSFSYKKQIHKSKGKAGRIPHPVGASPHSGARKNKLQKALEAREKKVRVPTIKARPGPTKRRPTKKELKMDRQLRLQDKAPNVYKMIEKGQTSNKMGGGKVYKKAGGSIKKGVKTAKASAEKREPKVEKQRKKSKGGVGYTVMGLAAGAIPIAGAASKAIPAIAKGVKTIKAGMKASKRNKAGSKATQKALPKPKPKLALPKPKPTETLTRPNPRKKLSKKPTTPESKRNPGKEKLKRRMEGEQRLRDSETGADIENMMEPAKFVRATKNWQKGTFKQKMKKQMKKAGGGKVKYRSIGGKVLNGNDITKMIYD